MASTSTTAFRTLAKLLLAGVNRWLLAGLFYLGSGGGLWLYRRLRKAPPAVRAVNEWHWLAWAIDNTT